MKIYYAKTTIGISLTLPDGQTTSVCFDTMNDGQSMYRTANKGIMKAIESHPYYGNVIKLYRDTEPEEEEAEVVVETEPQAETEEKAEESVESVTAFTCFDDAREYVHDTFGVPKKKLMSKTAVINAAAANGVTITIEDTIQ